MWSGPRGSIVGYLGSDSTDESAIYKTNRNRASFQQVVRGSGPFYPTRFIGRTFGGASDRGVSLGENQSSETPASKHRRILARCKLTATKGNRSNVPRLRF